MDNLHDHPEAIPLNCATVKELIETALLAAIGTLYPEWQHARDDVAIQAATKTFARLPNDGSNLVYGENPKGFAYVTAQRLAHLTNQREARRRATLSQFADHRISMEEQMANHPASPISDTPAPSLPSGRAFRALLEIQVPKALKNFKPIDLAIIKLHQFDHLEHAAVAERLAEPPFNKNLSAEAVRQRHCRCYPKFRCTLAKIIEKTSGAKLMIDEIVKDEHQCREVYSLIVDVLSGKIEPASDLADKLIGAVCAPPKEATGPANAEPPMSSELDPDILDSKLGQERLVKLQAAKENILRIVKPLIDSVVAEKTITKYVEALDKCRIQLRGRFPATFLYYLRNEINQTLKDHVLLNGEQVKLRDILACVEDDLAFETGW